MKIVIVQKYQDDLDKLREAIVNVARESPLVNLDNFHFTNMPERAVSIAREGKNDEEAVLVVCGNLFDSSNYRSGQSLIERLKSVNPDVFVWVYSAVDYRGDQSKIVVAAKKYLVSHERMSQMIGCFAYLGIEGTVDQLKKFYPLFL